MAQKIFGDCHDEASGALKFNIGKIDLSVEQEIINVDMRIPVTVDKDFVVEKLRELSPIGK